MNNSKKFDLAFAVLFPVILLCIVWFGMFRPFVIGYTGVDLHRAAQPLVDALKQTGSDEFVCGRGRGSTVTYKGVKLDVMDDDYMQFLRAKSVATSDLMICPANANALIIEGGDVALKEVSLSGVGAIEERFKSVAMSELNERFVRTAQALRTSSVHWDEFIALRKASKMKAAESERVARGS